MKILVTGATGFIGQNLIKTLLDKNFNIHCIVRKDSKLLKIDNRANVFKYNKDINILIKYFNDECFDGVIHLASLFLVNHNKNNIEDLISSNIKFGTELLEASVLSNVKWFINTGTFWQNYENKSYNPINLYAATKEAFQNIAKYYTETSALIFTTIKLNDTFGPNDTRKRIFTFWDQISKTHEALDMSSGKQIIDISYIEDVISAYYLLIGHLNSIKKEQFRNKIFAVKSNERMTLIELSKVYEDATKKKLNINWGKIPYRERENMVPWENGRIVPNWEQKYTIKEGIINTFGEN